jgi:hypothetical protein
MADQADNLVLELLRQMRTDAARLENEFKAMRTEMRDGFNRVEVRLGALEQGMAGMLALGCRNRQI